jgi:hypothetical protein
MSAATQIQQRMVKGQNYLVWTARGTMILVEEGSMIVTPSSGNTSSLQVPAGACYTAEQSGWVQLQSGNATGPDGVTTLRNIAAVNGAAIKWRLLLDKLLARPTRLRTQALPPPSRNVA